MMIRDKRGLEIKEGDTLIRGIAEDQVEFIEVDMVGYVQAPICQENMPYIRGHDLGGNVFETTIPTDYVSICACYRDRREDTMREEDIERKQEEMYEARVLSTEDRVPSYDWLRESISEADKEQLEKLARVVLQEDQRLVGRIVLKMIRDYAYPSREAAAEELGDIMWDDRGDWEYEQRRDRQMERGH